MPAARPSCRGFSFTEMLVVVTIIALLFGFGLPGLVSAQRRLDSNNALNIITTVHNACVRNARQFGATGTVYGFTLWYQYDATLNLVLCGRIVPWEKTPSGTYGFATQGDARSAIGGVVPWDDTATQIYFIDRQAPAQSVTLGSAAPTALVNGNRLHIAYEPGTGFAHAMINSGVNPANMSAGQANLAPGTRTTIALPIWNLKQRRQAYIMSISAVGVLDVKNG